MSAILDQIHAAHRAHITSRQELPTALYLGHQEWLALAVADGPVPFVIINDPRYAREYLCMTIFQVDVASHLRVA